MTLHLAASFSRDAPLLGLCFAFTALLLGGGDATSVECTLDVNGLGLFAKPEKLLNERLEMLRQTLGA